MIPTYFLYQLAEYEGVKIEWHEFNGIQGLYTHTPSMTAPVITLSNALRTRERALRCVLAHELGHHFETAGHHMIAASGTSSVYATKNELQATKWAVNLLVPTDIFLECIQGGMDGNELCNYFFVLPEFITHKSEMLHNNDQMSDTLAELKTSYNVIF